VKKVVGTLLVVLASALTLASTATATHPEKVFVCKYVGTPGVDERLQTGQNPISVSVNAIPGGASVGAYFADAHGRSYVLAYDTGQDESTLPACPGGDPPPVDVCPNLEGNQASVPEGYVKNEEGDCVQPPPPPTDVCPNIEGNQETVPQGLVKNEAGNCVRPPDPPVFTCPNPDVQPIHGKDTDGDGLNDSCDPCAPPVDLKNCPSPPDVVTPPVVTPPVTPPVVEPPAVTPPHTSKPPKAKPPVKAPPKAQQPPKEPAAAPEAPPAKDEDTLPYTGLPLALPAAGGGILSLLGLWLRGSLAVFGLWLRRLFS
jgi:hypothetical protein